MPRSRSAPSLASPHARGVEPGAALVSVANFRMESAPPRASVSHSYAALAFYTGGAARVALRGEWQLSPGDVLIIPAGEPHRMLELSHPELWGLGFCAPCLVAAGGAALLEPFERVRAGAAAVTRIPEARRPHLLALFSELERVAAEPPSALSGIAQQSLLSLILTEVHRALGAPSGEEATRGGGVVAAALHYIEQHCLRPLSLTEVAKAVGRTPAHVTSALTRATGRSAGAWIVSCRMAESRRLLLHSEEAIDGIATRVGYADPTHFIRMFRREHGATPAAWRAASRGPNLTAPACRPRQPR